MTVHTHIQADTALRLPQFPGDRGDGYHFNDPHAPDVFRCGGCDEIRATELAYCPNCEGLTDSYLDRQSDEPILWLGSAWPQTEAF